jgi:hypothetical protein
VFNTSLSAQKVMKSILQEMKDRGKVPRVDQYLFIFLKILHAAIPTIEYDYTLRKLFDLFST